MVAGGGVRHRRGEREHGGRLIGRGWDVYMVKCLGEKPRM